MDAQSNWGGVRTCFDPSQGFGSLTPEQGCASYKVDGGIMYGRKGRK